MKTLYQLADGSPAVVERESRNHELARVLQYAHEAVLANSKLTFGQALDVGKRRADVHVTPEDEAILLPTLFKLTTRGFPTEAQA